MIHSDFIQCDRRFDKRLIFTVLATLSKGHCAAAKEAKQFQFLILYCKMEVSRCSVFHTDLHHVEENLLLFYMHHILILLVLSLTWTWAAAANSYYSDTPFDSQKEQDVFIKTKTLL